jgi:hypothetical protein
MLMSTGVKRASKGNDELHIAKSKKQMLAKTNNRQRKGSMNRSALDAKQAHSTE